MTDDRAVLAADAVDTLNALLDAAATVSLQAPSVHNTQPWTWRVHDGVLDLWADPGRQLPATDPDRRMSTVSCGVALQYACVALAATGSRPAVHHRPDAERPDLLARVVPVAWAPATARDRLDHEAILRRRTDRRPFGPEPVTEAQIDGLRAVCRPFGVSLHPIRHDQLTELIVAASIASDVERADPVVRAELEGWTQRPDGAPDGVSAAATVVPAEPSSRRVPLRSFAPDGRATLDPGPGGDTGTRYLVLWGDADGVPAWLDAGRALGAVLLRAEELGLGVSPMSDLVEVTVTRLSLRRMLSLLGHPYVVLRTGVRIADGPLPPARRRDHDDAVLVEGRSDGAGRVTR